MKRKEDLKAIYGAAVSGAEPRNLIRKGFSRQNDSLIFRREGEEISWDLKEYDRIIIFGVGLYAAPGVQELEILLGDRLTDGIVTIPRGSSWEFSVCRAVEAGCPIPDEGSLEAGSLIEALARQADVRTLVLTIVTGGGSSMISSAFHWGGESMQVISLDEKRDLTRLLLSCEASIEEISCLRRHLSSLKGGRLAQLLDPATVVTLFFSDVPENRLELLGSGLTMPDSTTYRDALDVVKKYNLKSRISGQVLDLLKQGAIGAVPDTPDEEDPIFQNHQRILMATPRMLADDAAREAESRGYKPLVLTTHLRGGARVVGGILYNVAQEALERRTFGTGPLCVMTVGRLKDSQNHKGRHGGASLEVVGGFLDEMSTNPREMMTMEFLAASTTGSDRGKRSAGAFGSRGVLDRIYELGDDLNGALNHQNLVELFEAADELFVPGITGAGMGDLQILVVY